MPTIPQRRAPAVRRLLRAPVVRTERTSEHFVTLTLGGEALAEFVPLGFDQCVRLFFPREGQSGLRLPTASSNRWFAQYLLMSQTSRPWVRNYTVRAFRPEAAELDVQFAVHEDGGPATRFALAAKAGDEVGLLDEGITFLPPDSGTQLIIADESAVPAALAVLEASPVDLKATVLLEVGAPGDIQPVAAPAGAEVRWLVREDDRLPGRLALDVLTGLDPADPPDYTWVAGESGLATGARRFLTRERGVPKGNIAFFGYWKHGRAAAG
ncbi:siderophore-interacting protein [Amycolatopsis jiangsuensis]|uniref:NADPH-dependent ferric siderophore reductase n=1 Tax=Amycolatopsis jiangsuensis TaxID=1181879 RepID=A0A840INU1_9PSEU|nr:siderophore-interacting protein [Amycolatopsis jiangsuensis]MBB4683105.1 NADPH-dependent ferric siderophore reductase [Amycolatopsis jiangsuensis]